MGGKKKDPNAPKRPMSAYFFFLGMHNLVVLIKVDACFPGDKRAEVKAANPEYKIGDIGKVAHLPTLTSKLQRNFLQAIGEMWRELDASAKVD